VFIGDCYEHRGKLRVSKSMAFSFFKLCTNMVQINTRMTPGIAAIAARIAAVAMVMT